MSKRKKPWIDKDGEVREMTDADIRHVRWTPLRDSFPELAAYSAAKKRGRPKSAAPKKLQSFKLSQDVIAAIKASGAGYNTRVEKVLRDAIKDGLF
jgi:uncharacterized protein (DUF4415 family)